MHHSMTPTYILYYANLDLVNVVSTGSSLITIKLNAFESVVFTRGNFISVNMFVLQNLSLLDEILQKFKQTGTDACSHVSLSIK